MKIFIALMGLTLAFGQAYASKGLSIKDIVKQMQEPQGEPDPCENLDTLVDQLEAISARKAQKKDDTRVEEINSCVLAFLKASRERAKQGIGEEGTSLEEQKLKIAAILKDLGDFPIKENLLLGVANVLGKDLQPQEQELSGVSAQLFAKLNKIKEHLLPYTSIDSLPKMLSYFKELNDVWADVVAPGKKPHKLLDFTMQLYALLGKKCFALLADDLRYVQLFQDRPKAFWEADTFSDTAEGKMLLELLEKLDKKIAKTKDLGFLFDEMENIPSEKEFMGASREQFDSFSVELIEKLNNARVNFKNNQ